LVVPETRVRGQAPWLVKHVVNPLMLMTGALPILTVRGRKSGKSFRVPINVVDLDGARYLTSPRGETGWSRNLRANGEAWLKEKGQERHYRAIEVPPEERAPIIAAYLSKWGDRTHGDFDRLPEAIDHPTFRLEVAP
jgi:deazaflavin-dependent oxidoreductase (nitroreductase family)